MSRRSWSQISCCAAPGPGAVLNPRRASAMHVDNQRSRSHHVATPRLPLRQRRPRVHTHCRVLGPVAEAAEAVVRACRSPLHVGAIRGLGYAQILGLTPKTMTGTTVPVRGPAVCATCKSGTVWSREVSLAVVAVASANGGDRVGVRKEDENVGECVDSAEITGDHERIDL